MKLCVVFPGIGYNADKPLLYYTKKYVRNEYKIIDIRYEGDPKKAKSSKDHLMTFYQNSYKLVEEQLSDVHFNDYDDVLFVSKSVGTALSERYAREHHLNVRSVLFTPLNFTFDGPSSKAIAFSGSADPWIDLNEIMKLSEEHDVPLVLFNQANHSLETGNIAVDLKYLSDIMKEVMNFINKESDD